MIKLLTPCNECTHCKVCKNKDNAKNDAEKLKNTLYSNSPNLDYDWDSMSSYRGFDITFKCSEFDSTKGVLIR